MQCIVMYAAGNCSYQKSVLRCKLLILDTYHPDILYLHEQGVRIHGCFSKPKGVCEQKHLGNAGLVCLWLCFILASCTVCIRTSLLVTCTLVLWCGSHFIVARYIVVSLHYWMVLTTISCLLLLLGEGEFGQRSVVDHAVGYLECAQQHPHLFRTPEVMLIFLYHNPKQKS